MSHRYPLTKGQTMSQYASAALHDFRATPEQCNVVNRFVGVVHITRDSEANLHVRLATLATYVVTPGGFVRDEEDLLRAARNVPDSVIARDVADHIDRDPCAFPIGAADAIRRIVGSF